MPVYLGFDSSTQSLTATAIEIEGPRRAVLLSRTFRFDDVLPQYGTQHGVLPSAEATVVHAPPLMWTEALDVMVGELTADRSVDWPRLRAISGSAQQHGSVYLDARAADRLAHLDGGRSIRDQLQDVFARTTSPVWMDSSTTSECRAIEAALGGAHRLARLTGSRAFERFTGPQIRKFAHQEPARYALTDRVHLVSSWLASLLAGRHASIDRADGSGMNLMDITTGEWSSAALDATAPLLASKLPPLSSSSAVIGALAPYWTARFNLPAARVVAWSGDNPCSLVGTGLVRDRQIALSLGTSDTIFGVMLAPRVSPDLTGHVFASPTGAFMGMTVFKNGSLARERIKNECGLDWRGFSAALRTTPAGNGGAMMIPWFEPEITPLVLNPRVHEAGLPAENGPARVRAVIEGQMMSMALHSRWMGVVPAEIRATGGASSNVEILQIAADVFGAPVQRLRVPNSAALGAALRAWHADALADGRAVPWDEIVAGFTDAAAESRVAPIPAHVATYREMIDRYQRWEHQALRPEKGSEGEKGSG